MSKSATPAGSRVDDDEMPPEGENPVPNLDDFDSHELWHAAMRRYLKRRRDNVLAELKRVNALGSRVLDQQEDD